MLVFKWGCFGDYQSYMPCLALKTSQRIMRGKQQTLSGSVKDSLVIVSPISLLGDVFLITDNSSPHQC